ncbi:MAG: hypothetical protein AB7Q00_14630 [Phycisphaerales bacterium]
MVEFHMLRKPKRYTLFPEHYTARRRLEPQERIVAWRIALTHGCVSEESLIDALWGDREDGGPLSATRTLYQRLYGVRLICPVDIFVSYGFGWYVRNEDRETMLEWLAQELQYA